MKDYFTIADDIIQEAYPDVANKGKGWWGESRVPNYGILKGAIAKALASQQAVEADAESRCEFCGETSCKDAECEDDY